MRATTTTAKPQTGATGARTRKSHGFTLIELLVVMALTAIIIVLVFRPLIDSFNLASRAGTQIESQTAAREVLREVSTTLSNAEFIYDNTRPNARINLWLSDSAGNPYQAQVQYGLVDFVAPGRQTDQTTTASGPTDPTTGEPITDPTLAPGRAGYSLPLSPGRTIERLFLGLSDNRSGRDTTSYNSSGIPLLDGKGAYHGYGNRWSDPQQVPPARDNRFTLYKATFLAYIPDPDSPNPTHPNYIPNLSLFHTGPNPNALNTANDTKTGQLYLNDPNFFYDNGLAGSSDSKGALKWAVPGWKDDNGDGQVEYWENWRAVAISMLQLPKADTIALARDDRGNILYGPPAGNPNGSSIYPTPRALITFAPTYVSNEAGTPATINASGVEGAFFAADTYTAIHGAWTTPYRVLVYQNNTASGQKPPALPTTITTGDPLSQSPSTFYEYVVNPTDGTTQIQYHEYTAGNPATDNVTADVGPMIDPNTGFFQNNNPWYAFSVDPQRGVVNFAFPQWVYMHDSAGNHLPQQYNPVDINKTKIDPNTNQVDPNAARYLLLDDTGVPGSPPEQAPAGTSPLKLLFLNPVQNPYINPVLSAGASWPQRVHIVPGSEVVYGPDQRPGPHYGWSIQYTRVAAQSNAGPGPNQYRIIYDSAQNAGNQSDPNTPGLRVGYIQFDSDSETGTEAPLNNQYLASSLPTVKVMNGTVVTGDPVLVTYNFQMNRPSDIVKFDYLTRELMSVNINSRLYDPATTGVQDTILTSQIKARNLQR